MGAAKMKNILSFDVEEWFVAFEPDSAKWHLYPSRIVDELDLILKLLNKYKTKATFFILAGSVMGTSWILRRILDEGHEIASHGVNHCFVYRQTPEEFRQDLEHSILYLEKETHIKVAGYRAPFFSVTKKSLWALEIVESLGLKYDSSIFPVLNHRYGIPEAPRFPFKIASGNMWEFPPATGKILGTTIGLGGVYFRFLPLDFVRKSIRESNARGKPAVLYFHPWEFDFDQPRITCSSFLKIRHYKGLKNALPRLEKLLGEFPFAPFIDVIDENV